MTRTARTASAPQASPSPRPRPRSRMRRGLIACGTLAALAAPLAPQAGAIPLDNDPPLNLLVPPVAVMNANPNPVVVPRPLVIAPNLPVQPIQPAFLGTLVTFSAAGSFDPNGQIVKYQWDVDGAAGFERTTMVPTTTLRHSQTGTIPVRVRVTDSQGLTATATVNLVRHFAPIARIQGPAGAPLVGDTITLNGGGSTDDGSIGAYAWDLDGDGTFERSGASQQISYGAPGPHPIVLRVTDNLGATSQTTMNLRVNERPTAVLTTAPPAPVAGSPATLSGAGSSDDISIARYQWDLDGDGTYETDTQAVPTTTHTFAAAGPAQVGLMVTDGDGATDTQRLTVQVQAPGAVTAADTTAPRVTLRTRRARVARNGTIALRLTCPATEQACTTTVRLIGLKRPVAGRGVGARTRTLPGGRATTVRVGLTRAARTAVRSRGSLKARAVIRSTDAGGNAATVRRVITIVR